MNPALRPAALFAALCVGVAASATPPAPARLLQKQGQASAWGMTPGTGPLALRLSDEAVIKVRVEAPAPLAAEPLEKPKATPLWSLEEKGPPVARAGAGKGAAVWEQE